MFIRTDIEEFKEIHNIINREDSFNSYFEWMRIVDIKDDLFLDEFLFHQKYMNELRLQGELYRPLLLYEDMADRDREEIERILKKKVY